MTAIETAVVIRMGLPCEWPSCDAHARPLYEQLSVPHYSRGASILPVPETLEEWRQEHRTARKRADRAIRLGYAFSEVSYAEHSDDIHSINVSLPTRQGRPMTAGYTIRRTRGNLNPDQTRCPSHGTHTYGVLSGQTLVAYLTLHRAGDLAMVSMILGHADSLPDGVMFLLMQGAVERQAGRGGFFYYNLHRSGTDGLRWNKERFGFRETDVQWVL